MKAAGLESQQLVTPALVRFDRPLDDATKVPSVLYLKWHLSHEQRQGPKQDGTVIRLRIDRPHYQSQAGLAEETRLAIMHDPD